MAGKNVFNDKDSMDINELAALNEEISDDLLDQLQKQVSASSEAFSNTDSASITTNNTGVPEDALLFEEPEKSTQEQKQEINQEIDKNKTEINDSQDKPKQPAKIDTSNIKETFDDNFIKKYKAKLQKQSMVNNTETSVEEKNNINSETQKKEEELDNSSIVELSKGNISEKEYTQEQKEYTESLDLLDGNIKYSKYVIYVEPENVDFIESLTVKERKNLINGILRNQDDISNTKQRFKIVQTIINHAIVAILTIAVSIPIVYFVINTSLEATVNNYRRSQTNFQTLYREKGKISNMN